jgi:hypothetical protein
MGCGLGRPKAATRPLSLFACGGLDIIWRVRRTEPSPLRLTQHALQVVVGILWLIDAGLQTQHFMFTSAFANQVVSAAGDNQPLFVSGPDHTIARWIGAHPGGWNTTFIVVQAVIGLGLLTRRYTRPAIAAAAVWSLSVWWLAEGLGGIFGGGANVLTGAPGAAVLLGVLGLAAWPPVDRLRGRWTAPTNRTPPGWLAWVWAVIWVSGGILQYWPDQRTGADLAARVSDSGNDSPPWLARIDFHVARTVGHSHAWVVASLAAVELLIGLGALVPGRPRLIACWSGIALAAVFWLLGQALGGITTGHASDLQTAPLLVVAGIAVMASSGVRPGSSSRRRFANGRRRFPSGRRAG